MTIGERMLLESVELELEETEKMVNEAMKSGMAGSAVEPIRNAIARALDEVSFMLADRKGASS